MAPTRRQRTTARSPRSPITHCRGTWTGWPRRTCSSAFAAATTCPTSTTRTLPEEPLYQWLTTSNVGLPGVPASLQRADWFRAFRRTPRSIRDKQTRAYFQADTTLYASFAGQHQFKFGVQADRLGNDVLTGESRNRVHDLLELSSTTRPTRPAVAPYGYYTVRSNGVEPKTGLRHTGGHLDDERRPVLPGSVDDRQPLDRERWCAHGARERAGLRHRRRHPAARARLQLRRQVRAPRRVRLRHQGRRPHEGVRQLGHLLRHLQARAAARIVRRRQVVGLHFSLDTPNWTTLVDASGCPPACPGRNVTGTPTGYIDFREPSLGEDAIDPDLRPMKSKEASLGIDHQLNDVMAIGVRYVHKRVTRAMEDTGFITARRQRRLRDRQSW